MFSTSRKLSAISFIFSVANVIALIMVSLYFIQVDPEVLDFHWKFAWIMFLICNTAIGLLLTIALRSFVQDSELEANSTTIHMKKLSSRIEELEKKLK